jgi:hypothetical protein
MTAFLSVTWIVNKIEKKLIERYNMFLFVKQPFTAVLGDFSYC